ncbi:hypothetical protein P9761_06805 [Brevibacillus centrosporus]|uniref:DUF2007 domain-containing protein n=1 Tax=Brevibacillus nitrificans TaxID=651560 RepID=A0A3M8CWV3_9BACL|nr:MULTISPECIES: hypothetical protein [Brevibacillus]MEC2129705.1 hypothetical protein [Brevibacillus centrosporus]MED4907936.1 hypothetical protein [Brevibacillus centrosporus]RNB67116.1 hypothetical protein EDM55_20995 [Brevibacillus centrosporus]RNB80316.1 hypothetical protein EDM59_23470 [Brevibacillus nitrificans]GED33577.1 hypothetical protein BCE02nite_47180 [Brevibacillus centrosporus]
MSLFQFLFSRHKSLIYTAFGSQDYFRVIYRLEAAGVSFRTRTHQDPRHHTGSFSFSTRDFTQYDIYVTKADEYKAQMAIHGN